MKKLTTCVACLLAACAGAAADTAEKPRCATNDRSSPPGASRMTWERANPIFGLFGKSVGWHLKKGPHSITHEDWRFFMDYARNELKW